MTIAKYPLISYLFLFIPQTTPINDRIIGGDIVNIFDYPYQILINYNNKFECGGVLISENIALSAAHCFQRQGYYTVRLGSSFVNKGGIVLFLKKVIIHPEYERNINDYDIAITFFNQSVQFDGNIKPVRLPDTNNNNNQLIPGLWGTVSGWGIENLENATISTHLRATKVPIFQMWRCKLSYPRGLITNRMFCAGLPMGGKDACSGDSGGPFVVNGVLYGLVSWGFQCAEPGYPGVYTNIISVRQFIKIYANL